MTLRTLTLLLILPLVSGCGHGTGSLKAACAIFPAPVWYQHDTLETQAWFDPEPPAVGYAAKWERLCAH